MCVVVVVVCEDGGATGVVIVVWRVVVLVASGSLAQETSIKVTTDSAEPNMIAFFIALIVSSTNDSSQVASPDVFRTKNSSFLATCRISYHSQHAGWETTFGSSSGS